MGPAVVCIGAITLDLITVVEGSLRDDARSIASDAVLGSGGPAATAAVALARLGIPVAFAGTTGHDDAATFIRQSIEREAVDVTGLRQTSGRSAMSSVIVDALTGRRSIVAYYGSVDPPDALSVADLARNAEWVHVDHRGWSAVERLRELGVSTPLSLDHGNPRQDADLSEVSLYVPTEENLRETFPGDDLQHSMLQAIAAGPWAVVVTRGPKGAVSLSRRRDGECDFHEIGPLPVPVVSTLGAGDVFHGALLAGLVQGAGIAGALEMANACAALSCRALDGRSAIPTASELDAFLADVGSNSPLAQATLRY